MLSVQGGFWTQAVEFLVFPSPTGYILVAMFWSFFIDLRYVPWVPLERWVILLKF